MKYGDFEVVDDIGNGVIMIITQTKSPQRMIISSKVSNSKKCIIILN